MAQNKLIFSFIAITIAYVLLPTQARPQNDDNDIFAVDGFAFDGPAEGLDPITFERTTSMSIVSSSTSRTTSMLIEKCINSCPITSEYNPVCGTDGVFYTNPGHLGCAQRCGRDVHLLRYGPCSARDARG
ncbi:hypothetical protein PV327_002033 [Microctonus hyperodae]|uniref:Kazal-like domain-containing protein n=1 Tax=Microctonus hyperodae TaxID=165561 RepID=A0AA39FEW4_MICHY|nr:hypothetical protein PV327_002033 [Microctonus hyperodae]